MGNCMISWYRLAWMNSPLKGLIVCGPVLSVATDSSEGLEEVSTMQNQVFK